MAKQLRRLAAFATLALLVFSGRSAAAPLKTEVYRPQSHRKGVLLAPMPREIGTRIHAPFQSGKCGVCHVSSDEKKELVEYLSTQFGPRQRTYQGALH